ncbi:MAG TPA: DUF4190 domain-containing protein [Homoserinimonas sp.]|nr:DUF4190 domain-containing protein [Homoserinimonas sp.]
MAKSLLHVLILIAWAAVVLFGMLLLHWGAQKTFYFFATEEVLAEASEGRRLILLGSGVLFLAALLARLMRSPAWACVLVAAPAGVVGGLTFFAEGTLLGPLSIYFMLPVALSAILSVFVFARPMRADHGGIVVTAPEATNDLVTPTTRTGRTNRLAIASVIVVFLFSPMGLILGHVALSQIGRTGERGRGLALAAVVLGWTLTVIAAGVLVYRLWTPAQA